MSDSPDNKDKPKEPENEFDLQRSAATPPEKKKESERKITPALPPRNSAPPKNPGFFGRFLGGGGGGGESDPEARMGFLDHLMELRKRLWISLLTIVILMTLSVVFYNSLFRFVLQPMRDINAAYAGEWKLMGPPTQAEMIALDKINELRENAELRPGEPVAPIISTSPLGTMMMLMWLSVGAGLLLSSPIILYQVWAFVAPGLKDNEKRAIRPVLFGGIFFFLFGAAIAYYMLLPVSFNFIVWFDLALGVKPMYNIDDYTTLLLFCMAISGGIFEIPLVVGVFAKLGIVKPAYLTKYWRFCVLGSFILGSVLSPGSDIPSMLMFSLMLLSVYLLSILMAYIFYNKK